MTPALTRHETDPAVVHILQLTDCHFPDVAGQQIQGVDAEKSFAAVTRAVRQSGQRYDLVLLTGDLAETPTARAYERLRARLQSLDPAKPCYCLAGNHDDKETMGAVLLGGNIRMEPRIALDHWQIVCLDSTVVNEHGGFLTDAQLALIQEATAHEPDKHLLIAVHHHPIPCESEWMDTMIISNASRLFETLQAHSNRTRAVVFGHIHQALDRTVQGIRFLGSPSTCCQFKPHCRDFRVDTLPPGFRMILLHPDGRLDSAVVYTEPAA